MRYDRQKKNKQKNLAIDDMCEMYAKKYDTFERFMIEANLKYPQISKLIFFAFKRYYLKKMYPALYAFSYLTCAIIPTFLIGSAIYLIANMCGNSSITCFAVSFILSIIIFTIAVCVDIYIVDDIMYKIEWYERGCPRDY